MLLPIYNNNNWDAYLKTIDENPIVAIVQVQACTVHTSTSTESMCCAKCNATLISFHFISIALTLMSFCYQMLIMAQMNVRLNMPDR